MKSLLSPACSALETEVMDPPFMCSSTRERHSAQVMLLVLWAGMYSVPVNSVIIYHRRLTGFKFTFKLYSTRLCKHRKRANITQNNIHNHKTNLRTYGMIKS